MVLLGVLFLAVTMVMLRPSPSNFRDTLPDNPGDPALVTWILDHAAHGLFTDPADLFDAPIFWPHKNTFAYSESMLPVAPVYALLRVVSRDPIVALNLLVVAFSVFNLGTTYALAHRILRRRDAALLSAFAFGFTSYVLARQGHPHLMPIGVFPLAYLALLRLLEQPRYWRAVLAGLANAVAMLTALYYGAIWSVCLVLTLLLWALRHRPRVWMRYLGPLVVMTVLTAVFVAPVARQYARADVTRPLSDELSLGPRDLITTPQGSYVYSWLEPHGRNVARIEHTYFPGFVAPLLGCIGLVWLIVVSWRAWRRRDPDLADPKARTLRHDELWTVLAGGVVATILALGPTVLGQPAPFRFFHEHVPGFSGIRATSRLAVPGLLAGALLAGAGFAVLTRSLAPRWRTAAIVAACGVVLLEPAAQMHHHRVDRSDDTMAVYEELDRRDGPVVELPVIVPSVEPVHWPYVEATRMLRSTVDRNPRFNGYSGEFPTDYLERAVVLNTFPSPDSLRLADELGIRFVVLHTTSTGEAGALSEADAEAKLDDLPPGLRAHRFGSAWLVDLQDR
ncbi:MAG TPA: hypothetical protein VF183_08850 [Acidimicrobiales bacterium]